MRARAPRQDPQAQPPLRQRRCRSLLPRLSSKVISIKKSKTSSPRMPRKLCTTRSYIQRAPREHGRRIFVTVTGEFADLAILILSRRHYRKSFLATSETKQLLILTRSVEFC